ncbi:MAG: RNA 2',3'-cyclic phosphodiesterase [Candidatus Heimdallarchaeum endolithica]|uniref:RNA 2',3'-cyclic phosphodiesterase n=1 Tax=Candidatus Heimdallarchaeum endolithica TaxID=2876572 RepID=A0A9Y1FPF8_9ARCH|nr:MAG: RNA 2',3'-cyclic phosphodiesterase [Candidatus Heimdallarchaeum endolithica]
MKRVFISIDVENEKVIQNIKQVQKELLETGSSIKLVELFNLHLTLEFLGEINEKEVEYVMDIISSLSFAEFSLSFHCLVSLPNENYIRVIATEVGGQVDILKNLQSELRTKLKKGRFKVDKRAYTPHLTIARVKSSKNKEKILKLLHSNKEKNFGTIKVDSINLKESILTPKGPKYITLFKKKVESNV